ncbi:MAG: hypothetical protein DCC68_05175 [Planctomycetota bacterium]|nr:MAG: hypothetical protein DCC68_05175 [Planctomycetota bacterium]
MICAEEASGELRDIFDNLCGLGVVRPTASAGATNCTECGERCRVEFISDQSGARHGYIHCRYCGVTKAPVHRLARWEIDTAAFLGACFSGVNISIQERVVGQLWQVGKANWAGRSREIWFARAFRRHQVAAAVQKLNHHPKAILFAPTEVGAGRWREATGNLVISLDAVVSLDGDHLSLDVDDVEGRIIDAGMGSAPQKKRTSKKRADIAAKIEALTKEVVKFLQAARNHAFDTMDRNGEPDLLKRPFKKKFCDLAGLEAYDFSRCHDDEDARELRLYWEMTEDLDQIMKFKGPISRGRRT